MIPAQIDTRYRPLAGGITCVFGVSSNVVFDDRESERNRKHVHQLLRFAKFDYALASK